MRAVIGQQGVVVAVDQEVPRGAGDERGVDVGFRERRAVLRPHAERCPVTERAERGHVARRLAGPGAPFDIGGDLLGRIAGDRHFPTPSLVRGPPVSFQIVGDRRKDVDRASPRCRAGRRRRSPPRTADSWTA